MGTRSILVISACFLLMAMPAFSQTNTGEISDRVTDQISSQTTSEKDDFESEASMASDHVSAVDLTAVNPSRDDSDEFVFGNYTGVLTESFFIETQDSERDFTDYDTFTDIIAGESVNDWSFWPDNHLLSAIQPDPEH